MKNLICICSFLLLAQGVFAQPNADSLAYQLQRKKITGMLADRSQRFQQYDESLDKHTGIFGFQTKKDIRRSNDILMQIVETDDSIFRELKVLLDYRTFEQKQLQSRTKVTELSKIGYMATINKLRRQNEQLLQKVADNERNQDKITQKYMIIIGLLIAASILLLLTRKRSFKA